MTHCNDDGLQIKVEPISPPEVSGAHEVPMDICQGRVSSTPPETAPLMHVSPAQWQMALINAADLKEGIKEEPAEILRTSSGTRNALKNKIQSGRRARGQEELIVKFEPEAKGELTETEIKKRERRKEQNRRAAQKCRIKKRELQSKALLQYNSLAQQNVDLEDETKILRSEVQRLKCLLQEHESSGQCKLARSPQNQSSPQTGYLKLATTTVPAFNHSFSQPVGSNSDALRSSEELKRQASIEKIVKDLEMVTGQAQHLQSTQFAELAGDETYFDPVPFTHDTMMPLDESDLDIVEYLQHLSQIDDEENVSQCIDAADIVVKDTPSDNPLKGEQGQYWGADLSTLLVAPNNRQCAVRNLNEEFSRCVNQDFLSTTISETIPPSPARIPFCSRHQQQATDSPNSSGLITPLNSEELPNRDHVPTIPVFDGSFFATNELSPISSYSSCTSSPSNLTSPSLFHSPAERHRCSPDTTAHPQVPSIFRFPPDARFSLSS